MDGAVDHSSKQPRSVDWGYRVILSLVIAVAIWLILTPLVPKVAAITMRRFHLNSDSFLTWAWQFPIPAMYNFANRYQFRQVPSSLIADGILSEFAVPPTWRYANHFPTRVFTFSDGRLKQLRSGQTIWVDIESSYRGQTMRSEFELKPSGAGQGYRLIRVSFNDAAGNDRPGDR
jgi:uncharacterized membrane protein YhaH (DUF805 family)